METVRRLGMAPKSTGSEIGSMMSYSVLGSRTLMSISGGVDFRTAVGRRMHYVVEPRRRLHTNFDGKCDA
jgi:hypothetical protein